MLIFFFLSSAFFPLLVILHFIQLFFYSILISQPWFIATLFGNLLWLIAIGYYLYITFLGYHSLHILDRTKIFLYPFVPLIIIFLGSLIANWNITQSLMDFYHFRVLWKLNCIRVKWLSKKKRIYPENCIVVNTDKSQFRKDLGQSQKSFLNRDSYLFQTEETPGKSYLYRFSTWTPETKKNVISNDFDHLFRHFHSLSRKIWKLFFGKS